MPDARLAFALATTITLAAPALSQDQGRPLDDLNATRINPFQVLIDFEVDGGACDEIGRPELGEVLDGVLAVTFPASSNAEVCTMQIKEHDVKYAIEADHAISRIEVTVTGKDGRVIGSGSTDVDQD